MMKPIIPIVAAIVVASVTPASTEPRLAAKTALLANIKAATPLAEYDHPYTGTGTLVITRTQDQAETRKLCPIPFINIALGCAIRNAAGCWVIISPDSVIARTGLKYDFVKRHEIAHCNGWPTDHSREAAK
jgi:hypothetical protein